jgi:hypothetical protein
MNRSHITVTHCPKCGERLIWPTKVGQGETLTVRHPGDRPHAPARWRVVGSLELIADDDPTTGPTGSAA